MPSALTHLIFGLALAAALGFSALRAMEVSPALVHESEYSLTAPASADPVFEQGFVFSRSAAASVHSGTLTVLADGSVLAAWFGGSREGAADVAIHASRRPPDKPWEAPHILLDRPTAEQELGLHLRKLGNPVLHRDLKGRTWLFFVGVSLGGWSTSFIGYKISSDEGESWSPARRLVTSPFINISTLVRTRPLNYADGSLALPVYHELAGKFGELLHLAADGRVISKSRMSSGRSGIQPSLVADDARSMRAYLRRVGSSPRRVMGSGSQDGGGHWGPLLALDLPNPDSSVAAAATPGGGTLLAYNPAEHGRERLGLALSGNGRSWRPLGNLEAGDADDEYSYPYLIRSSDGIYHLIYTWQRTRMVYVRFNDAWLESRP